MHRLEITGNTPEELYFNCIKTLSIMLKGAGAQPSAPVEEINLQANEVNDLAEKPATEESTSSSQVEQSEQEIIPPAPKKRGRQVKAVEPAKVDELDDPVPDLGAAPAEPVKQLTLDDDIKPRLQAISAACTKRGMSMPETVAYIQKLYAPFGIAKAPQLKPEQFAEFMEESEAYLDGTAEA